MSTAAVPRPPADAPLGCVLLADAPPSRVRRPADLVGAVAALLGIGAVVLLAVVAQGTTRAVTADARSLAEPLGLLLTLPVTVLEVVVTLVLPVGVVTHTWHRLGARRALATAGTLVVATVVARVVEELLRAHAGPSLAAALTVTVGGVGDVVLSGIGAGVTAMLSVGPPRSGSRVVRWSWGALLAVLALAVLRGVMTLPGACLTLLLGHAVGRVARWLAGAPVSPLHGVRLAGAVRRAGVDARLLRRADLPSGTAVERWCVAGDLPVGHTERARERTTASRVPADPAQARLLDGVPVPSPAHDRPGVHRLYRAVDATGTAHDVVVLDPEPLVVAGLTAAWDRLRGTGLDRRPTRTVEEALHRTALVTHTARSAGVRTPEVEGMARADGSAVLLFAPFAADAAALERLAPTRLTDDVLDDAWHQLRRAHAAGLSHLALDGSAVVVDGVGHVWLRDWHAGEPASSELSRRVDLAQMLVLLAVQAGGDRAVASALRCLTRAEVAALAPLLQPLALPSRTRATAGDLRALLTGLREDLVALVPQADAEPVRLTRFAPRTVLAWVLLGAILLAAVATFDTDAVLAAVRGAHPSWMLAAFGAGLLTYVGGGMTLAAFSPSGVGLGDATRVHLAARPVGLVAPAGIGPAAVNLRFLTRAGMTMPLALATVTLVQVVQFVVTLALLGVAVLAGGGVGRLGAPGPGLWWAVGVTAAAVAAISLVGPLRRRVVAAVGPTLRQAWPRLTWLAAHPGRLLTGVAGVLVMTGAYVLAFGFSLTAFGHHLSPVQLAVTYLVANSAGSVVPAPGGIGPVEAALTGGLTLAGVPAATALSAAVVFRLATFWAPVPLGWLMFRSMQRRGEL